YLSLAAARVEVDRFTARMFGAPACAGDDRARTAGGDDLHFAEVGFDAIEQPPRSRRQAAACGAAPRLARTAVLACHAAPMEWFGFLAALAAVGIGDAVTLLRGRRLITVLGTPSILLEIVGA